MNRVSDDWQCPWKSLRLFSGSGVNFRHPGDPRFSHWGRTVGQNEQTGQGAS